MNNVLIITGASRGIGAATARLAAAAGYAICVNYRQNKEAAKRVVADVEAAGGRALAVAADVALESDVVRLFETSDKALGRLRGLVNNAGILETPMRVDGMSAARLHRVLATNVVGAFMCAREAVRRLSTRHGGSGGAIVNVSSGAARLGHRASTSTTPLRADEAWRDGRRGGAGDRLVVVREVIVHDRGIHRCDRWQVA